MLRLKFERIRRGWSQADLGRLARIDQSSVSKIEQGRLIPTPTQLDRLAQAFTISTASVLKAVTVQDPEP